MEEKSALHTLGIVLGTLLIIFCIIFFLSWILLGMVLLVCMVLIGIFVIIAIVAVIMILAIPYYAITKKPEVQQHGSYTLDQVKGMDEGKLSHSRETRTEDRTERYSEKKRRRL